MQSFKCSNEQGKNSSVCLLSICSKIFIISPDWIQIQDYDIGIHIHSSVFSEKVA